ncbi:MAG: hypothetical protein Q9M18_01020, partial [Mariprofundaceae bacterium]|nr:hypothetical protein [Mariprofundaceae bacterium]
FLFLDSKKGSINKKILTLGFGAMYLISLYNGLIAHGLLSYENSSEFLAPAFLAFCFGVILIRKYTELQNTDLGRELHTLSLDPPKVKG